MRTTYAVSWEQDGRRSYAGKLELGPDALRLEARGSGAAGAPVVTEVPYAELADVRVGRTAAERFRGRPTLVLERRSGGPIRLAGVIQGGIVVELAERLAAIRSTGRVRREGD